MMLHVARKALVQLRAFAPATRKGRRFLQLSAARKFEVEDEKDFQTRVLNSSLPVVVAFHAVWCGPCSLLAPVLEECVAATNGQVELARVNVDQVPDLALQYEVSSVPAVLGVKNGKVKNRFVGRQDHKFLTDFVNKLKTD